MSRIKDGNIIFLPDDALPDIEELTGDLRLLAELIGVEKALLVGQFFHGTPIRIWGVQKFVRRYRDRCIRRDSESMTNVALARKYKLTDRQIINITGKPEPDERQLSLW